ncbi:MAG: hypothetical protein AB1813_16405 [Verrucomicrobiota bacterium]
MAIQNAASLSWIVGTGGALAALALRVKISGLSFLTDLLVPPEARHPSSPCSAGVGCGLPLIGLLFHSSLFRGEDPCFDGLDAVERPAARAPCAQVWAAFVRVGFMAAVNY